MCQNVMFKITEFPRQDKKAGKVFVYHHKTKKEVCVTSSTPRHCKRGQWTFVQHFLPSNDSIR